MGENDRGGEDDGRGEGKGYDLVGKGGGASTTSVSRRSNRRGGGLGGGGPDLERGRGLLRHMLHGGDMEGSGGDSQSPLHRRHHLPQLPPWITGRSQYMDSHPRAQDASAGCSIEGGRPPCDITGPTQGLQ